MAAVEQHRAGGPPLARSSNRRSYRSWIVTGPLVGVVGVWLLANGAREPATFANLTLIGLTIGALYALVAVGYTLVYGVIGRFNFAHGDVFVYGAMISASASRWLGLRGDSGIARLGDVLVMLALAVGLSTLTSLGVERVAFRPLLRQPPLASLVAVIGVTFVLENIALVWQGDSFNTIPPVLPAGRVFDRAGIHYSWDGLIVLAAAALLAITLQWVLGRTRFGKAYRATAQDVEAAAMLGVRVERTVAATFVLGGALAGAAGFLFLLYEQSVSWELGFHIGLVALSAAVLGGIGNPLGAFLGALLMGLTQSFNEGFAWHTPGSDWTTSIVFAILISTLVLKPEGLLGTKS
jgi:branched-chain amino acid transport system permease protein